MGERKTGFALWTKEELRALGRRTKNPPRPCSTREMTEVERAWLGAMVEAEGWVGYYYATSGAQGGYWRIAIGNTDPEIISAALRLTEVGSIQVGKGVNRPIVTWTVARQNDVASLARQLSPYCMKVRKVTDGRSGI